MNLNRWWAGDPAEAYWLETTDRADLGIDLKAPQRDDGGAENWSYALLTEVADGDVVFHYELARGAITAWSRAVGEWWEEDIVWGSHAAGAKPPARRPGFRRGLEGPYPIDKPVTLADVRGAEPLLRKVRDDLQQRVTGSIYFPFELSDKRPPRATQFYLTKLPAAVVRSLTDLAPGEPLAKSSDQRARPVRPAAGLATATGPIGLPYKAAPEEIATSLRNPWFVDPDVVDRGLRGHAVTQNALARDLVIRGFEPRSPAPTEPQFDTAWEADGVLRVAEVKSLTARNEEQQLRLGLGQVLRYRHLLLPRYQSVRSYLVVERQPRDETWLGLCAALGVVLCWPESFPAETW